MVDNIKDIFFWLTDAFAGFVAWAVLVVSTLGYGGIVAFMAIESTFVPLPSEVVIPPAGYLTVHGDMNVALVVAAGTFGSILGACINYSIAFFWGRGFLDKYGKFLFLPQERLVSMDRFFSRHGEITTFVGRLIPGVRHYISFPAGLAKMSLSRFIFYTGFGALIWITILAFIGRTVGNNIDLVKSHLHTVTFILIPVIAALVAGYIFVNRLICSAKKRDELGEA